MTTEFSQSLVLQDKDIYLFKDQDGKLFLADSSIRGMFGQLHDARHCDCGANYLPEYDTVAKLGVDGHVYTDGSFSIILQVQSVRMSGDYPAGSPSQFEVCPKYNRNMALALQKYLCLMTVWFWIGEARLHATLGDLIGITEDEARYCAGLS